MKDFAIDVHDLRKSFGSRRVIDGFSLQVEKGEICGFLGANGSGKTTIIRMLCGLLVPDSGGGTCLGMDIVRDALRIRQQVGYMTQRFSFYDDLTVQENLALVAGVYQLRSKAATIRETVSRMALGEYRDYLAGHLSGGWKQRLALAACVLHRPSLLLLDEPTAGVDIKARREFWDLIHDLAGEGLTVLVSTHYMDEAERCTRLVYLAEGRVIVQGGPHEITSGARLAAFEAAGADVDAAAKRLRSMPAIESAAVFGRVLHISGPDRQALEESIRRLNDDELSWREVEPRLDDVFIHQLALMERPK